MRLAPLREVDPAITEVLDLELKRQEETLELIASENAVSAAVLEAQGSILTNKYAEGLPGRRYYGGCEHVDQAERLARERVEALFGAAYSNVQPHSGTQAVMAAYFTLLKPGDTILGMNLSHGGHLSHGSPVNFSGQFFQVVPYGVDREREEIDFDQVEELARAHRPKLIVAGASAYPRIIDFKRFREIADGVGARLFVDMAHIAGLVAAGLHPNPVPFSDIVAATTHKTLRGPRGGFLLCNDKEIWKKLNKKVFPMLQGGPLMHIIAAKAVGFKEAQSEEFRAYQRQIVSNAKALAKSLIDSGLKLISGGTDNHLMLIDLRGDPLTGREAEDRLERAGITVNKNAVPFDPRPPMVSSGIRIGTPAVTTRGMGEAEMGEIGRWISQALGGEDPEKIRGEVKELCRRFPLYAGQLLVSGSAADRGEGSS